MHAHSCGSMPAEAIGANGLETKLEDTRHLGITYSSVRLMRKLAVDGRWSSAGSVDPTASLLRARVGHPEANHPSERRPRRRALCQTA